jgi:hypothetical protein
MLDEKDNSGNPSNMGSEDEEEDYEAGSTSPSSANPNSPQETFGPISDRVAASGTIHVGFPVSKIQPMVSNGFHYISRDQPKAHKLTNHILHPSPDPSRRSPGAPEK